MNSIDPERIDCLVDLCGQGVLLPGGSRRLARFARPGSVRSGATYHHPCLRRGVILTIQPLVIMQTQVPHKEFAGFAPAHTFWTVMGSLKWTP